MRIFAAICLCITLAACQQTQDTATNAYGTVGDQTGKSYDKIGEIIGLKKPPPPKTQPAETRYCYKTYNDIICYNRPLPGEEYRLVGYQQANGKTGYVMEPNHVTDVISTGTVKPLPSVTVGPPPPVKGTTDSGDKQLKEVIFDPAELEPKELVPDKPQ